MAADAGFEPAVDIRPSPVFETGSLNHSDNLPYSFSMRHTDKSAQHQSEILATKIAAL